MNNFYYLQISTSLQFLTINLNKYNINLHPFSKLCVIHQLKLYNVSFMSYLPLKIAAINKRF